MKPSVRQCCGPPWETNRLYNIPKFQKSGPKKCIKIQFFQKYSLPLKKSLFRAVQRNVTAGEKAIASCFPCKVISTMKLGTDNLELEFHLFPKDLSSKWKVPSGELSSCGDISGALWSSALVQSIIIIGDLATLEPTLSKTAKLAKSDISSNSFSNLFTASGFYFCLGLWGNQNTDSPIRSKEWVVWNCIHDCLTLFWLGGKAN